MSTYLELCQKLGAESGTAGDGLPSTVLTQVGRLAKIVRWVRDAYTMIQQAERDWLWLQGRFSGPTIVSQRNYDGNDMGVTTRLSRFLTTGDGSENRWSIYLTSTGVSDEGPLKFIAYDDFVVSFMRGTQTNGKPAYFTVAPDGDFLLHPIPDAIYTIQGPYRKAPQTLAADTDEPEMPDEYHDLIVEVALHLFLGIHDETPQLGGWQLRKMERYNQLRREQLPRVKLDMGSFA
jgi:hypothetical protein